MSGNLTAETIVFCGAALAAFSACAAISLDAPGHVYVEGDAPVARGGVPDAACSLTDWRGRPVHGPDVFDADGVATLPHLPTGYYHLKSGGEDVTLAVVPKTESRVFDHGSFYGVDSAQSWISRKDGFACPWNDGDTFRTVSDLIWRAGIPHVRDRLSWSEVNPRPGPVDYAGYMYNADLLRNRGVLVSGMFHDAPKWAGRLTKLPSDLNAVYRFCADAAAAFGDRMGDWEFWNEEDISFAPEPVWDYAAALKAAYIGFKAGRPGCAVLPGALCQEPDSAYARALFDNDAAKFCDAYNLHVYSAICEYPGRFAALRSFMADYGIGDRAVWVTECGTHQEGPAKCASAKSGVKSSSPDQELVVAEHYAKAQVALQMEGVSRNYHFVFGAYNGSRGAKDWGVMRRDGTVKPVYAAISAMTRELVSAHIVGEMDVGENLRAYVFVQPDGSQTLVYWSVSPMDMSTRIVSAAPLFERPLALHVANGRYRLSDLCGVCSYAAVTNVTLELAATRFPAYVSGLHNLAVDRPAHPKGRVASYVPATDEDLSVVLRVDLDRDDFAVAEQKTCASLIKDAGRLRVHIWNLGDNVKTGRVDVAGGVLEGLPETIVLGARGSTPASFDCTFIPSTAGGFERCLSLSGVFNSRRSSRLVMPLFLERRFLDSCETAPFGWCDLNNWRRNTSADSYSLSLDENEKALRFDFAWNDAAVDRWFYPVYDLKTPQESIAGADMIQFEVKSVQDKVENDFAAQNVMLVFGARAGVSRRIPFAAPLDSWETRRVHLPRDCSLADVTSIRLGANPKGGRCTFWVRNLAVLRRKGGSKSK